MSVLDIEPRVLMDKHPPLGKWNILLCWRGSIAHGTYEAIGPSATDDKDVIGIAVPPLDYYLGLSHLGRRGTFEVMDGPWDAVVYESRKTFDLLRRGSPSALPMLWLPAELYINLTLAGRYLLERRSLFATKDAYRPFIGYARQTLLRLKKSEFHGYKNKKRKELVEAFGYDTKSAMHLIRLLRTVEEFMRTGELPVVRADSAELLEIKRGEWSLERIRSEAEDLFGKAHRAFEKSSLPEEADRHQVNVLATEIALMTFNARGELPN